MVVVETGDGKIKHCLIRKEGRHGQRLPQKNESAQVENKRNLPTSA